MFAVIADDLSGAAEIAGQGLQFGISSEIKCEFAGTTEKELLVINTSSRALGKKKAYKRVKKAAEFLMSLNPEWIYKKTDSVLRGPVLAELSAIMKGSGLNRSLLLPANPGMGRTIVNGKYMVNDFELTETSFAQDPEHPCKSADVLKLMGEFEGTRAGCLAENQLLPEQGVFIGEIKNEKSLQYWAGLMNDDVLPAGGVEFFTRILQKREHKFLDEPKQSNVEFGRTLFVCGSKHQNSRSAIEQARDNGAAISCMPIELISGAENRILKRWQNNIISRLEKSNKLILSVPEQISPSKNTALRIQSTFSRIIEQLLTEVKLDTLVIEGGETGQAITKNLKINNFYPKRLLAPGVVELSTQLTNPSAIIMKPGSYVWPESLWCFSKN